MSRQDFNEGDYIEHMNGDTGRVVKVTREAVHVKFDRGKGYWKGEYDDLWFRMYPNGLKKIDEPMWLQQTPGA